MYFVEKIKATRYFKQFDYILFGSVILLSSIGLIVLSSATNTMANPDSYMQKQIFGLCIGIVCAISISFIDYKDFKALGLLFYIASVILLIIVLFFGTGDVEWGSRSWLYIKFIGMSFQPSEPAKIAFIMVAAIFLERIKEGIDVKKNILKLLAYSGLIILLILLEPDLGTAIVYMFIFCVMVFICGIPYRYIVASICAFIASSPILWFFVLQRHQKDRIMTFLFPSMANASDEAFQLMRSILAIGSGGLYGKGLYNGIQTQNGRVPVKESDFIFTVIGEELGFTGSIILLLIVFFILFRCIYIAKDSRDIYGSFLVIGLTAMYGFHFIENIGMCVGVMPVTGIPMPFVSYGGTAMISNYLGVGVILSVSMRRKRALFDAS